MEKENFAAISHVIFDVDGLLLGLYNRQLCRSGCLIYNGTYLTLSLTLTITLTLLTLTVTVRVTITLLTLPTLLTLILDTVVNKASTSAG